MNRRSMMMMGMWAVPAITLATTAPAYATSAEEPEPVHVCHKKECRPEAKGRKIRHPSGAKRWEIRFTGCEFSAIHTDTVLALSPIPVVTVVWTPMPGHGAKHKTLVHVVPVDYEEKRNG